MKALLPVFLLLFSSHCFSQNVTSAKDTMTTIDGKSYAGTLISRERNTGAIQFMTEDSVVHHVAASKITSLKVSDTGRPIPKTKAAEETPLPDELAVDWSDPRIPHSTVVKHKAGLGLAIAGTPILIGGLVLVAVGIEKIQPIGSVVLRPVGGVGILISVVGLPMTICGFLKLAHARKTARAATR